MAQDAKLGEDKVISPKFRRQTSNRSLDFGSLDPGQRQLTGSRCLRPTTPMEDSILSERLAALDQRLAEIEAGLADVDFTDS